MLAFFRRRKWLWVILIAVFSVALVVSLVPMGTTLDHIHITGNVATVGSEAVTATEFHAAYHNALTQVGLDVTPEILQAIGFETQVVNQLVDQNVLISEAKRLGLNVSAMEIERRILQIPELQVNGAFIGLLDYQNILAANGMTIMEFENTTRNDILREKLFNFLTAAATVSDEEVEIEYRYQNERVRLDYVVLDGPSLEDEVELTEAEQREYYEKNGGRYRVPEKRRVRYVFVDTNTIEAEAQILEEELLEYYEERQVEYLIPPSVRVQHILFGTQGKTMEEVAEIRDRATDVLERAKAGEDFGDLAREFSEDGSASAGGDLGTFGPGQMVPEFEDVAFSLGEGATSNLVETQFGIHIIRVNEKQEGRTQPLEEVRASIESILKFQKANDLAANLSQTIAVELIGNDDFEAVAQAHDGAEVRETGLLARGEGFPGLADTAALENRIFSMALNEIGTGVPVSNGHVIASVVEIEEAREASFEEALEQVEGDLRTEKSQELARERSVELEQMLEEGRALEDAAGTLGLEVQTSGLLTRDGSIEDFGSTTELDDQIFTMEAGATGRPVTVAGKTIAFAVTQKEDIDPELMQVAFDGLQADLLLRKQRQLFEAYSLEVRNRMELDDEISVNLRMVEEILRGDGHIQY